MFDSNNSRKGLFFLDISKYLGYLRASKERVRNGLLSRSSYPGEWIHKF